jgi:hypothetical protein
MIESKILETRKIWRPTPNLESVSKKVMSPFPKQIYWGKVTRQQNTPDIERFGVGDKEKFPVKNGSHTFFSTVAAVSYRSTNNHK